MRDLGNIHGTTLIIKGLGCLIRGRSGSGKSLLALDLLGHYGKNAALVADDQTLLHLVDGHLIATCPPPLKGKIELYGRGIIDWPCVGQTKLDIIIDLVEILPRIPEENELTCQLFGIDLPRIPVPERATGDPAHQRLLIEVGLNAHI